MSELGKGDAARVVQAFSFEGNFSPISVMIAGG
jgi:hypothetical protein